MFYTSEDEEIVGELCDSTSEYTPVSILINTLSFFLLVFLVFLTNY